MGNNVLTLPENKVGRDFVVGDIHGAFDLLDKALLAVNFDPAKDRVIAVGDLINRGNRSPDCLDYLSQPWFYSIRGNHEELLLYVYKDGKLDLSGLHEDVQNSAGLRWMKEASPETLDNIRAAVEKLPLAIEIQTAEGIIGVVHGEVPVGMDWKTFKDSLGQGDKKSREAALWGRERINNDNASGVDDVVRVFTGHTPIEGGPKALGNCFFLDTGGVFKEMNPQSEKNFYLTIAEIQANAADICNPQPTQDKLVRKVTAKKPAGPGV